MIVGVPGSAILAAAQQAQAQQGLGRQVAPALPDTAAATAQAAVDSRGPILAPETAIQAQAAEKEQDSAGDDVARRIFEADAKEADPTEVSEKGADGLTPAEERQVRALQQQDAAIRRHEQAHAAAGGAYAGAPQYQYTTGPDGRRYAIGGEVSIQSGAVRGNPQATIAKLQAVKRAALAPANPSPQDRRVAAQADLGIAQARIELREERAEEVRERQEEPGDVKDDASSDAVADAGRAGPDPVGDVDRAGRVPDSPGPAAPNKGAASENGISAATDSRPQSRPVAPGALLDLVV